MFSLVLCFLSLGGGVLARGNHPMITSDTTYKQKPRFEYTRKGYGMHLRCDSHSTAFCQAHFLLSTPLFPDGTNLHNLLVLEMGLFLPSRRPKGAVGQKACRWSSSIHSLQVALKKSNSAHPGSETNKSPLHRSLTGQNRDSIETLGVS